MYVIEHDRYQLSSVLCLRVLDLNNVDCSDASMVFLQVQVLSPSRTDNWVGSLNNRQTREKV